MPWFSTCNWEKKKGRERAVLAQPWWTWTGDMGSGEWSFCWIRCLPCPIGLIAVLFSPPIWWKLKSSPIKVLNRKLHGEIDTWVKRSSDGQWDGVSFSRVKACALQVCARWAWAQSIAPLTNRIQFARHAIGHVWSRLSLIIWHLSPHCCLFLIVVQKQLANSSKMGDSFTAFIDANAVPLRDGALFPFVMIERELVKFIANLVRALAWILVFSQNEWALVTIRFKLGALRGEVHNRCTIASSTRCNESHRARDCSLPIMLLKSCRGRIPT